MEIIINKNDIKTLIEGYKKINNSFTIKSFTDGDKKKRCVFYLDGSECTLDIFIKEKSVNFVPTGKNIPSCKLLIEYISSKGYEKDKNPSKNIQFKLTEDIYKSLLKYISDELIDKVKFAIVDDVITKFIGYNGDEITLHFWKHKNNAMIQGRPFYVYNVILNFLSTQDFYEMDEIVALINDSLNQNVSTSVIREQMKNELGNAYNYLGETLLKCVSTTLTYLKSDTVVENYAPSLAGTFIALEGYLIKILKDEYKYTITKKQTFGMFYVENGSSQIDDDMLMSDDVRTELKKLYKIYSDKRNVYLHSSIDPELTPIIQNINEAKNLASDIVSAIKCSYEIIF